MAPAVADDAPLSDAVKQRIEENRRRAQERRSARAKAALRRAVASPQVVNVDSPVSSKHNASPGPACSVTPFATVQPAILQDKVAQPRTVGRVQCPRLCEPTRGPMHTA